MIKLHNSQRFYRGQKSTKKDKTASIGPFDPHQRVIINFSMFFALQCAPLLFGAYRGQVKRGG
jgi:hypothetical protein